MAIKLYDSKGFEIRKGKIVRYQGSNWEVVTISSNGLKLVRYDGNFKKHDRNNVNPHDTEVW